MTTVTKTFILHIYIYLITKIHQHQALYNFSGLLMLINVLNVWNAITAIIIVHCLGNMCYILYFFFCIFSLLTHLLNSSYEHSTRSYSSCSIFWTPSITLCICTTRANFVSSRNKLMVNLTVVHYFWEAVRLLMITV